MQEVQILFGFIFGSTGEQIQIQLGSCHVNRQAPSSYVSWWSRSCCCCCCWASWGSRQICPSTSCIMQSRGQPRLSSSYRNTQSCEQLLTWDPTAVKDSHTLPNSRRGDTHTARLARLGQLRPRLSKETRVPAGCWMWSRPVAEQLPLSNDEGWTRSSYTNHHTQEENDEIHHLSITHPRNTRVSLIKDKQVTSKVCLQQNHIYCNPTYLFLSSLTISLVLEQHTQIRHF